MAVSARASEIVIETLAASTEALMAECREQKQQIDELREQVVEQRAKRQEYAASAAQAVRERDQTLRKVAAAERRIETLQALIDDSQGRVAKLQAALEHEKVARNRADALVAGLQATNAELQGMMTADAVRAQAVADHSDPDLVAAMAVVEAEDDYQRAARGEPTTQCPECGGDGIGRVGDGYRPDNTTLCPACGGTGQGKDYPAFECPMCKGRGTMMGIPDAGPCGTCGGTKVVRDDAPAHLDEAREGATAAAMSNDIDADSD